MELPKLQQLAEGKEPSHTITVDMTADDQYNFVDSIKGFKKLKYTQPKVNGRKAAASVTGTRRDLVHFLTHDDGAGYDIGYVKKKYPDIFK